MTIIVVYVIFNYEPTITWFTYIRKYKMKKSLLVLALMATFAGSASAVPLAPLVTGSVTSSVAGSVATSSSVANINGMSSHAAFATSENVSSVIGVTNGVTTSTDARTLGSTSTSAGGVGSGSAGAYAQQAGFGTVTAGTLVLTTTSEAAVNTHSGVQNVNTATGTSSSIGSALNVSTVTIGSTTGLPGTIVSHAVGTTSGNDSVVTTGSDIGAFAGGASAQAGSYFGTITNVVPTNVYPHDD